jgi:hypothetical protein
MTWTRWDRDRIDLATKPVHKIAARATSDAALHDGRKVTMAVMVTFTLKTDKATYQRLHSQMLALAIPAGLLFHSSREVGNQVGITDFWPSAEAWTAFSQGPLAQGMKSASIAPPDDLKITPLINANAR